MSQVRWRMIHSMLQSLSQAIHSTFNLCIIFENWKKKKKKNKGYQASLTILPWNRMCFLVTKRYEVIDMPIHLSHTVNFWWNRKVIILGSLAILDNLKTQFTENILKEIDAGDNPGGGTPHTKGLGMLVVSLGGVNLGFWSHLGCSGQNAIIFSREGLV